MKEFLVATLLLLPVIAVADPTTTPAPVADPTTTPAPVADTTTPAPVADTTTTPAPVADPTTTPAPVVDPTTTPAPVADTTTPAPVVDPTTTPAPAPADVGITFNQSLPFSQSSDLAKPGCQTVTQGYSFNVTMLGWNLSASTCTAKNLFSNLGYVTTGQIAARGNAQAWISPIINGSTFSLKGFTIKNYGSANTLYVDTFTAEGSVYTTVIAPSITSVTFDTTAVEFRNLTSVSIRSTNNRFDLTKVMVQ